MKSTHSVEQRLAALERQLKAFKSVCAAGLLVLASTLLLSASSSDRETVTANRFVLVDDKGRTCGSWMATTPEDGGLGHAFLSFHSEDGMRVGLSGGENPMLLMNGGGSLRKDGRLGHVHVGVDSKLGPRVSLWGQYPAGGQGASTSRKAELLMPWAENAELLKVTHEDKVLLSLP